MQTWLSERIRRIRREEKNGRHENVEGRKKMEKAGSCENKKGGWGGGGGGGVDDILIQNKKAVVGVDDRFRANPEFKKKGV